MHFFRSLIGNSLTKEGPINDHKGVSPGDPEMMAHDGPLWCWLWTAIRSRFQFEVTLVSWWRQRKSSECRSVKFWNHWPGMTRRPKIQLMDPKRWDFEVFYRVISMSQDMGGSPNCCCESEMSLVMSSVWRSSEPAAADVWTPSIWTSFAFLMNLIILIGVCWFFFITRFLSAWAVWIGISTAWLDEPWAVTDPWSFRKWRSK